MMKPFRLDCEAGDVRAAEALMNMLADMPGFRVQVFNVADLFDDHMVNFRQYFGEYAERMLREITEEDPGEEPIKVWQAEGTCFGAPVAFSGAVGYNMVGVTADEAIIAHFGRWFTEEGIRVVQLLNE